MLKRVHCIMYSGGVRKRNHLNVLRILTPVWILIVPNSSVTVVSIAKWQKNEN